jgi:hypothetical protein
MDSVPVYDIKTFQAKEDLYESIYDPACCLPHPELLEPQRNKKADGGGECKEKHWKNKFFLDVAKMNDDRPTAQEEEEE